MEISIHEEKLAMSHFTGTKTSRSRVTKIPFTTIYIVPHMRNDNLAPDV